MTGAIAMTHFTPDAEARLAEYLREVRSALAGVPDVNPDEIEADIREHIDAEFHSAVRPVTAVELEAVLVRLGPPEGWVVTAVGRGPDRGGEMIDLLDVVRAARRRILGVFGTLWRGPEDWRLAYLAFGLFCLGVLTVLIGVGVLLLAASYVLARAALELAREKQVPLGARRWLVYPPMLLVSVPLFLAVMLWPAVAAQMAALEVRDQKELVYRAELTKRGVQFTTPPTAEQVGQAQRMLAAIPGPRDQAGAVAGGFTLVGALAAWWTIAGLILWTFPRWPVVVFHPLLDGYDGGHGLRLAGVSGVAFVIWAGFAARFLEKAGLS